MFRWLSHHKVWVLLWLSVSKNYLSNDHSNKYSCPQQPLHHSTRGKGDQGGGISFFKSYISLGVCARVQLNTFHILSINNANTCGGTVDIHSPILPVNLHYTFCTHIYLYPTYIMLISCLWVLISSIHHAYIWYTHLYTSIHILSGC